MEKAAIYARVSTDEQKKHGISLDAQVAQCEWYAKHEIKDTEVEVVYVGVEGLSGKNTNRPELQKIMSLANKKQISHVLVVKGDRLSRETDDSIRLAKMLTKNGVTLHLTTEGGPIDFNDPAQEAMYSMKATFATFERRRISMNTKFALARKRDLGQRISRHAPYGFKFKANKLIVNTHEQGVIRRIHELDANGYSLRSISQTLFEEGIFNRCHKKLEAVQVWRILKKAA